jgi:hypothetical protein
MWCKKLKDGEERTTEGEQCFQKGERQLKQAVSFRRWEEELKALAKTFLSPMEENLGLGLVGKQEIYAVSEICASRFSRDP